MITAARWLLCAAFLASACTGAARVPPHPGIDRIWRDYAKLPDRRALAIAGDPNGLWVGAAAGGAHRQVDASDRALEECRRKRADRRMQSPCLIYAAGDVIFWPGAP